MNTGTVCFPEEALNLFRQPARVIIAGFTNSGKSQLSTQLVLKYASVFTKIIICGVTQHPLQNHPSVRSKIVVEKCIIDPLEHRNPFDDNEHLLFILDDTYSSAVQSPIVLDAFIKGRHENLSCILITQNVFFTGKYARDISLNASHYILLRSRDVAQIETLARQIFGKCRSKQFVEIYQRAVTCREYGYLLVDLAPDTPIALQMRSNIVDEKPCEIVYQWR